MICEDQEGTSIVKKDRLWTSVVPGIEVADLYIFRLSPARPAPPTSAARSDVGDWGRCYGTVVTSICNSDRQSMAYTLQSV